MHCEAVIFDMDGTLLDTLADIAESANIVLAENGLRPQPLEDYRQYVGEGVKVLFRRASQLDDPSDGQIEAFAARFSGVYAEHYNVHTEAYVGVPELLRALVDRGLPLAILSNKPHAFTVKCAESLLPEFRFAAVLGQQQSVPRKPDPAGALQIARQLNVPPDRCLYVGDTGVDMRTAAEAGMYGVGALWGFRGRDELVANGARELIDQPSQLLEVLDRLAAHSDMPAR
jgi:phosphoglycolate phosphatase